jgi:hypothetical protein
MSNPHVLQQGRDAIDIAPAIVLLWCGLDEFAFTAAPRVEPSWSAD